MQYRKRGLNKNLQGFSLVEMCIVVSLLIFVSSAGISHLMSWREQLLLRFSAQALTGELNRARIISIACGFPVEIRISEDKRTSHLQLRDSQECFAELPLPEGLSFIRIPRKPIVFFSSGSCTPSGSFVISGDDKSVKVVVSIMGRVRWEFR